MKYLIPLYCLFIFTISNHIVYSQTTSNPNPLYHICFGKQNYSSSYGRNLQEVFSEISFYVINFGFGRVSRGQGEDHVNVLELCRGDQRNIDCNSCITPATSEILKLCPYSKGAVIWYDNCSIKYSDEDFFGKIDYTNKVYLSSVNKVSDPIVFNKKTRDLITGLSEKAVDPRVSLFATGEMALGGNNPGKKLYGLVQCTRDLSSTDCKKCLDDAVSELPNCCNGKRGGKVIGGSCNIRYELYRFYN